MAQYEQIKARIQSITSIGKITKAMQLVSIAKLKKINKKIWEIKAYSAEVYKVFNEIIKRAEESIYLAKSDFIPKKTMWIIINSNIGLCGGYNLLLNKLILKNLKENDELFIIGQKGESYFKARRKKIYFATPIDINFTNQDSREMALRLHKYFTKNFYDSIKIGYTKFINNITTEPVILDLLPIVKKPIKNNNEKKLKALVEFDPDVETILNETIILYLNTIIYSSIIESQVSEYSSRRNAMENATKNAKDLKEKLTLEFNRKRQDNITQEISEIVSGSNV